MGSSRRMTVARYEQILQRQSPLRYGQDYVPSIKATREEAPSNSAPGTVLFPRIGRPIHTLSRPERHVLAIIMYCPRVIDVLEQRMLPVLAAPHPLADHPLAADLILPRMRGTLAITNELGQLHRHPKVYDPKNPGAAPEPGCWIGDFLVILTDEAGPYCVNLSVKDRPEHFESPSYGAQIKKNPARAAARARVRMKVEEQLYAEVGIPTHRVAASTLNLNVVANLAQIATWCTRPSLTSSYAIETVLAYFQDALDTGATLTELVNLVATLLGSRPELVKATLYQLIMQRRLRVDLFRILLPDEPLISERRDVLGDYGHWFARGAA